MFEQLSRLWNFILGMAVIPTNLLYIGSAKLLPDWAKFGDGHAWWHSLILALFWIGVFFAIFFAFRWYARQQMELLMDRAWYFHRMKLYGGWQKWCSILFVFGFLLVPYLGLPQAALLVTCGCGAAVLVYDIVKAKASAPIVLLQQLYLSLLSAVYFILFSPIIFVLYVVTVLLLVFGVASKDIFSPQILVTTHRGEYGSYTERETI